MFMSYSYTTHLKTTYYIYVLSLNNTTMDSRYNVSTITLDVRISCDTFWNYKFDIPIRIQDYYNTNINNRSSESNGYCASCSHHLNRDPLFCRLEEYLVEYAIQHIYDDLMRRKKTRDVEILLSKARKFHIHGRTLEDILFPSTTTDNRNVDTPALPENIVYICTHC
jgi:hypothetical protein